MRYADPALTVGYAADVARALYVGAGVRITATATSYRRQAK